MSERIKSLDAHIHYNLGYPIEELLRTMDATDTQCANLAVVPSQTGLSSVPDALMAKAMYPQRFHVFASLDVSVYFRYRGRVGIKMREYGRAMLKCGCDGIKILEGKPNMRKELPIPDWDDPQWEPFFKWCQDEQVPILWHVNDPENFWDYESAPIFARQNGWVYDSSYINNEEQYRQVLALLDKFPKLKIIFAHFFFMSAQLERLSGILESYPNLMVDITPGIEMYRNFSSNFEKSREFFARYSKRIVYGTDIGGRGVPVNKPVIYQESLTRVKIVRAFLENSGPVEVPGDGIFLSPDVGFTMQCLGLDNETLSDILKDNFMRFVGEKRAPVDAKAVLKDIRRVRRSLFVMGLIAKGLIKKDTTWLNQVNNYFNQAKKQK